MVESAIPWPKMLSGVLHPLYGCRWAATSILHDEVSIIRNTMSYGPTPTDGDSPASRSPKGAAQSLDHAEETALDEVLKVIFDRYDLDNSGTINSNEELRNMIIYACYRLQTVMPNRGPSLMAASENVDACIAKANNLTLTLTLTPTLTLTLTPASQRRTTPPDSI